MLHGSVKGSWTPHELPPHREPCRRDHRIGLLGIRAVVTQSFERIHRSNLIGMGVMPLVFEEGTSWQSLGMKGDEQVTIRGLHGELKPRQRLIAEIVAGNGTLKRVPLICRIDTLDELDYFKNGGILQYVLRHLAADRSQTRSP